MQITCAILLIFLNHGHVTVISTRKNMNCCLKSAAMFYLRSNNTNVFLNNTHTLIFPNIYQIRKRLLYLQFLHTDFKYCFQKIIKHLFTPHGGKTRNLNNKGDIHHMVLQPILNKQLLEVSIIFCHINLLCSTSSQHTLTPCSCQKGSHIVYSVRNWENTTNLL